MLNVAIAVQSYYWQSNSKYTSIQYSSFLSSYPLIFLFVYCHQIMQSDVNLPATSTWISTDFTSKLWPDHPMIPICSPRILLSLCPSVNHGQISIKKISICKSLAAAFKIRYFGIHWHCVPPKIHRPQVTPSQKEIQSFLPSPPSWLTGQLPWGLHCSRDCFNCPCSQSATEPILTLSIVLCRHQQNVSL